MKLRTFHETYLKSRLAQSCTPGSHGRQAHRVWEGGSPEESCTSKGVFQRVFSAILTGPTWAPGQAREPDGSACFNITRVLSTKITTEASRQGRVSAGRREQGRGGRCPTGTECTATSGHDTFCTIDTTGAAGTPAVWGWVGVSACCNITTSDGSNITTVNYFNITRSPPHAGVTAGRRQQQHWAPRASTLGLLLS